MEARAGQGEHSMPGRKSGLAAGTSSFGDEGYVLLAVIVLVFLMLLTLTVAAPKVAMELKHDQELETQHRANQYVRAIRLFHKKTGNYPTSLEQLEKTNNQRFLRQRYLDPLTGKDDWKLIQVGQNKTTVKGFFGKDLPGLGGGLGAASGMQSSFGGAGTQSGVGSATSSGSAFGSSSASSFGSGSSFGAGSSSTGSSFGSTSSGTPAGGSGGVTGGLGGIPSNGAGSTGSTSSGSSGNGVQEANATDFKGASGPIMGVGVPKAGEAFLSVNGVSTYDQWEFLYDPRIEQMYAQSGALGGGGGLGTGSGPASTSLNGLGSLNNPGSSSAPGGTGTGASGTGGSSVPPPTGTLPQNPPQ